MDPEQWQAFMASLPAAARARMAANIVANQQAPAPAVAAETARTAGPSPVRSIGEMIAKSAGDAFTLPGRALYGEIPRADEMPQSEAIGEAMNFAGMVSTPAAFGRPSANVVSMSGAKPSQPIKAYHATYEPFDEFDFGRLGSFTKDNVSGSGVEDWAMNLAKTGAWAHEKPLAKRMGVSVDLPVEIGGKGKPFKSLDALEAAVRKAGGPDEFRAKMVSAGYGHVSVMDEEFGGRSYIGLGPDTFRILKD
jgi:hypothetical protein